MAIAQDKLAFNYERRRRRESLSRKEGESIHKRAECHFSLGTIIDKIRRNIRLFVLLTNQNTSQYLFDLPYIAAEMPKTVLKNYNKFSGIGAWT